MLGMKTVDSHLQNVSRETFSRLENYVSLLLKWNPKINLIGPATEPDVWTRHIEDSLQVVTLIEPSVKTLVDLGSGGGLPGLVIAIARPELQVTLVEQDQRKAAFLTEAKARLELHNVTVVADDISRHHGQYEVVTARALASLDKLLGMAKKLMGAGGICLFPKGEAYASELAQAAATHDFRHKLVPSTTLQGAAILVISNLAH